jgi:hypothetical protein
MNDVREKYKNKIPPHKARRGSSSPISIKKENAHNSDEAYIRHRAKYLNRLHV